MATGPALLFALALMQDPSPPPGDVSLTVECGQRANEVELTLRNTGGSDTAALLGISLANGRWLLPRELVVELTHSGQPEVERLVYQGTQAIAGRMDHWVVTLPVDARFVLVLRAADFISPSSMPTAPPEQLQIRLVGKSITSDLNPDMAGMKAWHLWSGTAVSNTLRLADCSR